MSEKKNNNGQVMATREKRIYGVISALLFVCLAFLTVGYDSFGVFGVVMLVIVSAGFLFFLYLALQPRKAIVYYSDHDTFALNFLFGKKMFLSSDVEKVEVVNYEGFLCGFAYFEYLEKNAVKKLVITLKTVNKDGKTESVCYALKVFNAPEVLSEIDLICKSNGINEEKNEAHENY